MSSASEQHAEEATVSGLEAFWDTVDAVAPMLGNRPSLAKTKNSLANAYFGNSREHTSILTATKTLNDADLPAYAKTSGEIHKLLRFLPAGSAEICTEMLPTDLQEHMEKLRVSLHSYRQQYKKYKKLSEGSDAHQTALKENHELSETIKKTFSSITSHGFWQDDNNAVSFRLKTGEIISTQHATELGRFLYVAKLAESGIVNQRFIPGSLQEPIHTIIGVTKEILKKTDNHFAASDNKILQNAFRDACMECHAEIMALLKAPETKRALQMAALMRPDSSDRTILAIAGDEPYPSALKTPVECALAIQALSLHKHDDALLPLAQRYASQAALHITWRVDNQYTGFYLSDKSKMPSQPISPLAVANATRMLGDWAENETDERILALIRLVQQYIKHKNQEIRIG